VRLLAAVLLTTLLAQTVTAIAYYTTSDTVVLDNPDIIVVDYTTVFSGDCGDVNERVEITLELRPLVRVGDADVNINITMELNSEKHYIVATSAIGTYVLFVDEDGAYAELIGVGVAYGGKASEGSAYLPGACVGFSIVNHTILEPAEISGFEDSTTVYVYTGLHKFTIKKIIRMYPDDIIQLEVDAEGNFRNSIEFTRPPT